MRVEHSLWKRWQTQSIWYIYIYIYLHRHLIINNWTYIKILLRIWKLTPKLDRCKCYFNTWIILSLANERRCYCVKPSLIGWDHTQSDPCNGVRCGECDATQYQHYVSLYNHKVCVSFLQACARQLHRTHEGPWIVVVTWRFGCQKRKSRDK